MDIGQPGPAPGPEALAAMVAQAEGLLIGRDGRRSPRDALALLYAAAGRGSAEALTRLAALAASGSDLSRTLPQALGFLRQAAALGSQAAAAQLGVLAGWTPIPPPVRLHDCPQIVRIGNMLPGPVCDWLVGLAARSLEPARMMVGYDGAPIRSGLRTNSMFHFNQLRADAVVGLVRARIAQALAVPVQHLEPPQILHYAVGQQFRPHHDALRRPGETSGPYEGDRAATFLVYLNDGFEGGETAFPRLGLRYRGRRGDALWFTNLDPAGGPDPLSLHAGLAPTSGEKWLLSQWIHDRPYAERVEA